jgi:hypothetical protein
MDHPVPVWVEAILPLDVAPVTAADGTATYSPTDLEAAATAVMPEGCTIVNALTVDQIEHVMNQQAAELQERLDETRRLLHILAGSVENGIASTDQVLSSLRNIISLIPQQAERSAPVSG